MSIRAQWTFGVLALIGFAAALPLWAAAAPRSYDGFGAAQAITIRGYNGDAMEPFITRDGRYLLFNNRNDGSVNTDLYYARHLDDDSFQFMGPLHGVNSAALEGVPSVDAAGELYFVSDRSYAKTLSTLYHAHFSDGSVTEVALVAGVSQQRPGWVNFDAEISADGQTLWVVDSQFAHGGPRRAVIVVARREGAGFVRRPEDAHLLDAVNVAPLQYAPCASADSLELLFTRVDPQRGAPAIYRSTRADARAPFGPAQWVAAATGFVEAPSLSADGRTLYFHRRDGARFMIYRARR